MNSWHIVEGILIVLGWKLVMHYVDVVKGMSRDKLIPIIIRSIEIAIIPILLWGDNHGWSFATRYFLLSVCMFGPMIRFCIDKHPITRGDVFWDIAIPLFILIIGVIDFKIYIKLDSILRSASA